MPLPSTIHLGFAKCGSTFLQAFWRQHPALHMVFKSNFFSPFNDCAYSADPSHYAEFFDGAATGRTVIESDEHLLMGLLHPRLGIRGLTLASVEETCRRIRTVTPAAKMLLVVRNQLEMMVSTYSQYLLGGGTLTLDQFSTEFMACSASGENYFSFYFDEIVEVIERFFPGQLRVVLAEELAHDTDTQLAFICEFMGVSYVEFQSKFGDRRIGLSKIGMSFVRGFNRLAVRRHATRFQPDLWLPKPAYKTVCNLARVVEHYALRRWTQGQRCRLASSELAEKMSIYFSGSNLRLAGLLRKDLSRWSYQLPNPASDIQQPRADSFQPKMAASLGSLRFRGYGQEHT